MNRWVGVCVDVWVGGRMVANCESSLCNRSPVHFETNGIVFRQCETRHEVHSEHARTKRDSHLLLRNILRECVSAATSRGDRPCALMPASAETAATAQTN